MVTFEFSMGSPVVPVDAGSKSTATGRAVGMLAGRPPCPEDVAVVDHGGTRAMH